MRNVLFTFSGPISHGKVDCNIFFQVPTVDYHTNHSNTQCFLFTNTVVGLLEPQFYDCIQRDSILIKLQ